MRGPIKQAENPNATKAKEGARQHVQAPFFLNKYTWCHHCPWTSDASFFSPQYRLTPLALQRAHGKADLDWWGYILRLPSSETSSFLGWAALYSLSLLFSFQQCKSFYKSKIALPHDPVDHSWVLSERTPSQHVTETLAHHCLLQHLSHRKTPGVLLLGAKEKWCR